MAHSSVSLSSSKLCYHNYSHACSFTSKTKHSHSFPTPATKSLCIIPSALLTFRGKDCSKHARKRLSAPFSIRATSRAGDDVPRHFSERFPEFINTVWEFARPLSTSAAIAGAIALYARVLVENPNLINWSLAIKAAPGPVALFCCVAYINGINQIYDVEIDKVNKPHLLIAAGKLSIQSAWALVTLYAVAGISIVGLNSGPFLTSLYCLALFLGHMYSAPPIRLKRFPFSAGFYIAANHGLILNYAVYYACRGALELPFKWSIPFAFNTVFIVIACLAVAIIKDLEDVEGDRKYGVSTLATNIGVRNAAFLGSGLFLANYIGAILVAIYIPQAFRGNIMIYAHALLAMALIFQAFRGNIMIYAHALLAMALIFQTWNLEKAKHDQKAIARFFQFIFVLYFAEYIMFPFI